MSSKIENVVGTDVGMAGETVSKENQAENDHPKYPDFEPEIESIEVEYTKKARGEIVGVGVDGRDLQIRPADFVTGSWRKCQKDNETPRYVQILPAVFIVSVDSKRKRFSVIPEMNCGEDSILIKGKLTKKMLEILKGNYPKYARKISEIRLEKSVSRATIRSYQVAEHNLDNSEKKLRQIGRIPHDIPQEKLDLHWQRQKVYDILRDQIFAPDIRED